MKRSTCVMLLALSFAIPLSCPYAFEMEGAVTGWFQDPGGDISFGGLDDEDKLDIEKDLKYEEESRIGGRLKLGLPSFLPNLYFVATPVEFDGTGAKDSSFRFDDAVFDGDVPFYSKLILDNYDVALYYGFPFLRTASAGLFRAELGINVRVIDFKGKIEQSQTGLARSLNSTVPIPMAYLALKLKPFERLSIEAEGRGLSVGEDRAYSLIGRVKLPILGPFFGAGGYRYDVIKIEVDKVETDLRIGGPFLELGLEF